MKVLAFALTANQRPGSLNVLCFLRPWPCGGRVSRQRRRSRIWLPHVRPFHHSFFLPRQFQYQQHVHRAPNSNRTDNEDSQEEGSKPPSAYATFQIFSPFEKLFGHGDRFYHGRERNEMKNAAQRAADDVLPSCSARSTGRCSLRPLLRGLVRGPPFSFFGELGCSSVGLRLHCPHPHRLLPGP